MLCRATPLLRRVTARHEATGPRGLLMKTTLAALSLGAAFALPTLSFAEDMDPAKITCAEYEAMDSAGMMHAVEAMSKAGPDGAVAMDDAKTEEAVKKTAQHCTGKPDMMAMEAMTME